METLKGGMKMSSKHHRGNRCEVSIFDEVKDIENEDIEDVVETESEVEIKTSTNTIKGVVSNCNKLKVRMEPNLDSIVLRTVNSGTEITIDVTRSTDEWYYVQDLNGFCMKEYITVIKEYEVLL